MSAPFRPRLLAGAAGLALALLASHAAHAQAAPQQYTSYTRYDALGRVTGTIAPDPDNAAPYAFIAVRNTYDTAGNLLKVEKGVLSAWLAETVAPKDWTGFTVNTTIDATFDNMGRKLTERVKGADLVTVSLTQFSYTPAGSLECTAVRMNPAAFASPPASACTLGTPLVTGGVTVNDRITKTVYVAGDPTRVEKIQQGLGTPLQRDNVSYGYTANGKLASVTDARGLKASYSYDGFDRMKRWNLPDKVYAGTPSTTDYEEYTYDVRGNRTKLRKRDGSEIDYQYDALSRATTKLLPAAGVRPELATAYRRNVATGYDLRGLVTKVRYDSISGDGLATDYDGFGRIKTATQAMDGASRVLVYQYDANGNRTELTWMDGAKTSYAYDGLNRLTGVFEGPVSANVVMESFVYDSTGQLDLESGRYGAVVDPAYDQIGRLSSLSHDFAGVTQDVSYSFTRNAAGQLASQSRSNDSYAWTAHSPFERDYAVNGLNQYTVAGSASLCYDANGNLTADGSSVFLYDFENRLVEKRAQVHTGGCANLSYTGALQASLRYDPMGRLYESYGASTGLTTRLLNDGDALVAEYGSAGTLLRRYVQGADAKADDPLIWYEGAAIGPARWMRRDAQGSVVAVADAANTVIVINRYDEYGIPQSGNQGRFGYTGQAWLPEIGMWYYKARIYSPTLGRFLQTDPIGYNDQVNLYAYVGNDPVNRVDPTGMYKCDGDKKACELAERAREDMMRARRQLVSSGAHAAAREVGKALQQLGTDDNKGPLVMIGTPDDPDATADYRKEGRIIRVDLDRLAKRGSTAGEVIGHELGHDYTRNLKYEGRSGEVLSLYWSFTIDIADGGRPPPYSNPDDYLRWRLQAYVCAVNGPMCDEAIERTIRGANDKR